MIRVLQSTVSECVRRVAKAVVNAGARNKWVHFLKTSEEKAAEGKGFTSARCYSRCHRMHGRQPHCHYHTQGCVALVNGDILWSHFSQICDADTRILAVDPMRSGSDHDSFVWRMTWLRRWFQAGRIANSDEYLLGDSGYPLEPWLLTPVPGHPPTQTAEGEYSTAHAAMRSVVERCTRLLKSRFRCLQRYRSLLYEAERAEHCRCMCCVAQPSAV
ncbi:hypothetical protein HPB49_002702 [Dermacentor silvarum]|uniref:Uncharacterized protein n=1 Tax=Dermacentor silvarum TaxID=543639 RepID=A0ACB8CP63_DERSI|nr:hypothetical protein HPB49_002702 [Dermacentor silvarum]